MCHDGALVTRFVDLRKTDPALAADDGSDIISKTYHFPCLTSDAQRLSIRASGIGDCRILQLNTAETHLRLAEIYPPTATEHSGGQRSCAAQIGNIKKELEEIELKIKKLQQEKVQQETEKRQLDYFVTAQLSQQPSKGFSEEGQKEFELEIENHLVLFKSHLEQSIERKQYISRLLDESKTSLKVIHSRLELLLGDNRSNTTVKYQNIDKLDAFQALSYCKEIIGSKEHRQTTVVDMQVELSTRSPGPLGIELNYIVDRCGWKSSFVAEGSSTSKDFTFSYEAIMTQNTKEDWTDVHMTLSGSTVGLERPPTLGKETVTIREEKQPRNDMPAPRMLKARAYHAMAVPMASSMAPCAMRSVVAPDAVTAPEGRVLHLEIPGKFSMVSSDKMEVRLNLTSWRCERCPLYRLAQVPKEERQCKVEVRLAAVNKSAVRMPKRSAIKHYIDGKFLGEATLEKDVGPGERFGLTIATDHSTLVRCIEKTLDKETGWTSKSKQRAFTREVVVKSPPCPQDMPTDLFIIVAIPTSKQSKINVNLIKPEETIKISKTTDENHLIHDLFVDSTAPGAAVYYNKTTNHLIFNVKLEGSQPTSTSVVTEYTVDWPTTEKITIFEV